MEDNRKILTSVLVVVVCLAVGAIAGYYVGLSAGQARVSAKQMDADSAALAEIQKKANPFTEVKDAANPFKQTYTNPFAE